MSELGPDRLETVTPAGTGDARRLTTKAKVKALLGITTTTDDTLLDQLIDRASADCVSYCGLAADGAGSFPTFGAETLRATWYDLERCSDDFLLLPWRPRIAVTAVSENGVSLTAGTDYRLLDGGLLQRLSNGQPMPWATWWTVIATFTAGWSLPDGVDPALEGRVIDQVKMAYKGRDRDNALRSLQVPGVYQASFSVAGGDSIGESGLLIALETALAPYRRIPV
ncbi:phage head-tail connector protein [uncultured Reyranella sp.]|uniref:phage head-tail connector protein n=1 Tax=uncultured Reyranella sp. TaxID=735512 RepID=UPI00259CB1CD|nr:phage head-tail connector protein [uncultured Reyranella sp.]